MVRKLTITLLVVFIFSISIQAQQQKYDEKMVLVKGGEFMMGNDYSNSLDEAPEHKVVLSDFYIGKYEVTFEEFDRFCEATGYPKPDDGGFGRGKLPVANISWQSAVMYCNWLSASEGKDKYYNITRDSSGFKVTINKDAKGYRLPTEAEWEYAARGGSKATMTAYSGSNNPDDVAWYKGNSGLRPHEVGTKKPNELGIHDMSGNAWEWCWDVYEKDYYKNSPEQDPMGAERGTERVYRGGNWNSTLDFLRLTHRFHFQTDKNYGLIGLRLARNAN